MFSSANIDVYALTSNTDLDLDLLRQYLVSLSAKAPKQLLVNSIAESKVCFCEETNA